jgi:hypothetical protein
VSPEPQSRVAAFRTPHQPVHRRARHDPVLDLGVTSFRFSGCMAQWGSRSPPLSGKALKPSWLMCWRLSRRSGPTLAHHSKRPFPFCTSTFRIGCLGPEGALKCKTVPLRGTGARRFLHLFRNGLPWTASQGIGVRDFIGLGLGPPQNSRRGLKSMVAASCCKIARITLKLRCPARYLGFERFPPV